MGADRGVKFGDTPRDAKKNEAVNFNAISNHGARKVQNETRRLEGYARRICHRSAAWNRLPRRIPTTSRVWLAVERAGGNSFRRIGGNQRGKRRGNECGKGRGKRGGKRCGISGSPGAIQEAQPPGELPKSSRIRVNGQSGSRLAGSLYTVPVIQTLLYTESTSYCAEWKLRLYTPPPHPSGKPSCSRVTPMLGDQHEKRSGQSPLRGLGAVSLGVAPEPEIREAGQDAQPPPLVVQRLPC